MPGEQLYFLTERDRAWLVEARARLNTLLSATRGQEKLPPVPRDPPTTWVRVTDLTASANGYPGLWSFYDTSTAAWVDDATTGTITADADGTTAVLTNCSVTAGIIPGCPVSGAGIPSGATVKTVDSDSQLTLSANTTAAGTGVSLTVGARLWVFAPNGETLALATYYLARACDDVAGVPVYEVVRGVAAGGGSSLQSAKVSTTTAQAFADGTGAALSFDNLEFDDTGYADLGTHSTRLTAVTGGTYLLGAEWAFDAFAAAGQASGGIVLNGNFSTVAGGGISQSVALGDTPALAVSVPLNLLAGDYVEAFAEQTSGSSVNVLSAALWLVKIA